MHTTLYRKWRPSDFSSVCGQDHITGILRYEVQNGKTTHAYLFCGSRGTGKTTCAKILAKAINCENPIDGNPCGKCRSCLEIENGSATDIIEMDAASNNGVDYIRDLRDEVVYTPATLKKRVYIIDEVHMLSSSAFNALLKTLEEPPEHVVFILATTELQKLPATITSRCQRFDFKRISTDDIASRLEFIAKNEDISITHEAAKLIGRLSQGGMRDSISLLELCAGHGKAVDTALVNETAGVTGKGTVTTIVRAVLKRDHETIFRTIADFIASSVDILVFWQELIEYYRDMLVIHSVKDAASYLDLTSDEYDEIVDVAMLFTRERILYHIRLLEDSYDTMQRGNSMRRTCAEMTLIRMSEPNLDDTPEAILSRLSAVEEKIAFLSGGNITAMKEISEKTSGPKQEEKKTDINGESKNVELTSLPSWAEIVQSVERNDNGAGSMLRLAKGYRCGNNVEIHVYDSFSVMLLGTDEVKSKIASAVNMCGDADGLRPENISVILKKENDRADDPLSSLVK